MRTRILALFSALVVAACGGGVVTSSTPTATTPPTTSQPVVQEEASCLDGTGGFFGDGPLGSQAEDSVDAATVTGLTLTEHDECERLIVDLAAASGAPATSLGTTRAELLRRFGVVRIHLDEAVAATTLTDIVFDGRFTDRVYVVRDSDGSLFIDVHLVEASVARFSQLSNPVRLALDIAPGGAPIQKPEVSDYVVVMPIQLDPDTTIEGYGRTFEANVIVRARQGGEIVAEDFTTSSDYLETWGFFEMPMPSGITGGFELFIGEDSARDGEEQGVRMTISLDS